MQLLYWKPEACYGDQSLEERRLNALTESGRIRIAWANRKAQRQAFK